MKGDTDMITKDMIIGDVISDDALVAALNEALA